MPRREIAKENGVALNDSAPALLLMDGIGATLSGRDAHEDDNSLSTSFFSECSGSDDDMDQ
jgi:hypothetical protein